MKNKQGMSLIEVIFYTAIIAIVFILVVNSLSIVIKAFNQGRVSIKINNSAETAMERMTREIRFAYDVDDSSVLGSSPGHLVLNTYSTSSPEVTTLIEFYIDSGKLMIKEGDMTADQLTSSDLSVTNLIFREIIASSISKAVKIEMTLQGSSGNYQKIENFYNTAILRKSY
ncbi:type II secretion system GspH family protein [Patescibacteria group bacterium]|nr:type II secretion system GspH family protein [Patescibacteria group bacterium]